jgi:hypothetical protein
MIEDHLTQQPLRIDSLTHTLMEFQHIVRNPADCCVAIFLRLRGTAPDADALRQHVAAYLPRLPALTHRLVPADGGLSWEPDPEFDLAAHIRTLPGTAVAPTTAGEWLTRALEPERPLWRMWLLDGDEQEWGLVYLIHHAAQDAVGMVRTLETLFGQASQDTGRVSEVRQRTPWQVSRLLPSLFATLRAAPEVTAIATPPGRERELTYATVSLADLRAVAKAGGATVGQVHLAAMAGAIGRWSATGGRGVPVCVPVDTRLDSERDNTAGSFIGLMRVVLPCSDSDPRRRLRKLTRRTTPRKVRVQRSALRALSEDVPAKYSAAALKRLGDRRNVALTVSSVRFSRPLRVLGSPVEKIVPIPWLPPGHHCFSLMITYEDQAVCSVLTDARVPAPMDLVFA